MQTLGVPYPKGYENQALADAEAQAQKIVDGLAKEGLRVDPNKEIIALIAYMQRLGTDIKKIDEVAESK